MATTFDGKEGHVHVDAGPKLSPNEQLTIECHCRLNQAGKDPTIISRPISDDWTAPYVAYRLGFHDASRCPEFQLLACDQSELFTARAESPLELGRWYHIAATYDGSAISLFVDGDVVAHTQCSGSIFISTQPVVIGARSHTDPGGFLGGSLEEVRFWGETRTQQDIRAYSADLLPIDSDTRSKLLALWSLCDFPLPKRIRDALAVDGWNLDQIECAAFSNWYGIEYNKQAPQAFSSFARAIYPDRILTTATVKLSDGIISLYDPRPAATTAELVGMRKLPVDGSRPSDPSGFTTEVDCTIAEFIFGCTGGLITLLPDRVADEDRHSVDHNKSTIRDHLRSDFDNLPKLTLNLPDNSDQLGRRFRITSPVFRSSDGTITRVFEWLHIDVWHEPIDRRSVYERDPHGSLSSDLWAMNHLPGLIIGSSEMAVNPAQSLVGRFNQTIEEFLELINRSDVDEVRDIQPFLSQPENWFLLDPNASHVWPEKKLGNKFRVDFVIRDSWDEYTAVEIESPKFRLFTKKLDPSAKLTHAEQQVRDYCHYIDRNRNYVEREEGLPEISHPKGLVVIGRDHDLTKEGAAKLKERNADGHRYTIRTYDGLVSRARNVLSTFSNSVDPR